jgi:lambda repressor-like predicted transcriptional regulator
MLDMQANIWHYDATQSSTKWHYHTVAGNKTRPYKLGMSKTDERKQIAEKHRAAINAFMERRGLTPITWCRRAGLGDGTLRNFLYGHSDTVNVSNLELLARAVGSTISEVLGEGASAGIEERLMKECTDAVQYVAKKKGIKLEMAKAMAYSVMLYNHVREYRAKGEDVSPSPAIADLIVQRGMRVG